MEELMGNKLTMILDPDMDAKLNRLPPGPWHASGAGVYAGKTLVALIVHKDHRRASALAEVVARLPDWTRILGAARLETMLDRIADLEHDVRYYESRVGELEKEVSVLKARK